MIDLSLLIVIDKVRSSGHIDEDNLINLETRDANIWKTVSEKKGFLANIFHVIYYILVSWPVS